MKTISKILTVSAVAVAALTTAAGTAQAQNTNYTDGDLVLFFQNPGGSGSAQQVFASLGNTATVFRAAFTAQSNLTSIVNIGATLTSAFGSGWANATTLYGGAGGVWSDGSQGTELQNGDPSRTVYTTLARPSIGVVGSVNSDGFSTVNSGGASFTSAAIIQQNNIFETQASTAVAVIALPSGDLASSIPLINPAGGSGWNENVPAPGVQQQGQAGSYGTFGSINNVEFMWDLYRSQARNNISGQYGQGEARFDGSYIGTIVLTESGDVSFITSGGNLPATPYESWAAEYAPAALSDKNADFDGDGFTNFQEFAFGTDPTIGNAALVSASTSGSNLVITALQRTAGETSGITSYALETRADLTTGTWLPSGVAAVDGTPVGEYTPVTYTVPRAGARGFYRLIATE
jgi:hypothetical protein